MPKIDGRKYEVELDNGKVVSRQHAHYLLNKDVYDKRRRETRYNTEEKKRKHKEYRDLWAKRFEEEHGVPYWKWRKDNRSDHKKSTTRKYNQESIQS